MTVAVAVEIGGMTLGARAACPTIDGGIAMTIDSHSHIAIGRIVAGGANALVDTGNPISSVAGGGSAGGSGGNLAVMIELVLVEVQGVALATGSPPNDESRMRPIGRIFQQWWCGMAI